MEDLTTQLGVATVIVLLLLDKVFAFLKTKKNGTNSGGWLEFQAMIKQVHEWVGKEDGVGKKLIYGDADLKATMIENTQAVRDLTQAQNTFRDVMVEIITNQQSQ